MLAHLALLRKPVVTEKATACVERDQITFKVAMHATKKHIQHAVETIFKVSVLNVNTLIIKGKRKRFRQRDGKRADYKKAIVTLKKGQSIDLTAKIEVK